MAGATETEDSGGGDSCFGGSKESSSSITNELADVKMDLKLLNCPVCHSVLGTTIYQCNRGHAICHSCHNESAHNKRKCVNCDQPTHRIDFSVITKIIRNISASCHYSSMVCKEKSFPLKEKARHERRCPLGPCVCPIEGCGYESPSLQLLPHVKERHPSHAGCSFSYNSLFTVLVNKEDKFDMLHSSDGIVFLLLKDGFKHSSTGNLSVACMSSSGESGLLEKSFKYKLSVSGARSTVSLKSRVMKIRRWSRRNSIGTSHHVPSQINGEPAKWKLLSALSISIRGRFCPVMLVLSPRAR